ncbi:MAG TPA: FMN-binding protein [Gemmatimonadaceae bacterium]|jgi:electron transport complex protein RnfG|nr:FMN-binding protein [Gemmatimonadaceae bacterium]
MSMGMTKAAPVVAKDVRSWKLMAMMTGAGAIAGLLIVSAYTATLPRIEQHQGQVMQAAITEVLKAPASYDTLYLYNGALAKSVPAGTDTKKLEKVYLGHDGSGKRIGFAVSAAENGFQDLVTLMFGYDASAHKLIAMKVIGNKETPGLGNKIETDSEFVNGFVNAVAPINGVKKDRGKTGPSDVVMITGATISSRAVIRIIDNAIARWQPLMDAYHEETKP